MNKRLARRSATEREVDFLLIVAQTIQNTKDMDQEELAEALPRLHEEAVQAEKALRVAQERVRAANGQQAKCPAFVEFHGDQFVVNVKTRDKKSMLLSSIRIPPRTRGRRGSR